MVSWVSYHVVAVCLASVPITHFIGLSFYCPSRVTRPFQHYLTFPLTGGNRHLTFQVISWFLWSISALAMLPLWLTHLRAPLPIIPRTHVDVISGAAAACSFLGELFMFKSLLVYEAKSSKSSGRAPNLLSSPRLASAVVVVMGLLITTTGFLLLMSLEYMPDVASRVLYCCLSLSCLLIGASSTYGLGGFLCFGRAKDANQPANKWQFFQPFSGGSAFVATQALGWSLFSATIVSVAVLLKLLVEGIAYCTRCWAVGTGCLMVATQTVMALSLALFSATNNPPLKEPLTTLRSRVLLTELSLSKLLGLHLPIWLMYLPVHAFFAVWTLTFTFLPLPWCAALWVGFMAPYYLLTTRGQPQHTGCRRWTWLCSWFSANVERALVHYFGSLEVVRQGDAQIDANKSFVFGFHPHGMYPTGAGYLPLLPSFQKLFPGVRPVTLTASVMYFTPFIRDIVCWSGFRQVARRTFLKSLSDEKAVILCPGGQAELVHAYKAFKLRGAEFCIHTRHRGFIRMAIEHQAQLVPVLALGEILQLRNLVVLPAVQQYTYRRLGFPVPFILGGRWFLSPLPKRVPLKYILGDPITPPPHKPGSPVDESAVELLHQQYFSTLKAMYEEHAPSHPSFQDVPLRLVDN